VYIEREAAEATLMASVDIVFESPRNRLIGGRVLAGHEVIAAEIGAVGEIATRVSVGVDPFTADEQAALAIERKEKVAARDRGAGTVAARPADPATLAAMDPNRKTATEKLFGVHDGLVSRIADIDLRLEELRPPEVDETKPRVIARLAMRPGVFLTVGRARRLIDVPRFRVAAVEIAGAVELVPIERDAARIPRSKALKV
jgi:hypothetical protein